MTALLPAAAAALFLWLAPRGCDIRGDVAIYRWTCLLPGLLLVVPLGVALLLPPLLIVGRRRVPPVPDGWLVTILATGAATELVFLSAYFLYLDPAYRALFLKEALLNSATLRRRRYRRRGLLASALTGALAQRLKRRPSLGRRPVGIPWREEKDAPFPEKAGSRRPALTCS